MSKNSYHIIGFIVVVIIALCIAWYMIANSTPTFPASTNSATTTVSTTTVEVSNGQATTTGGHASMSVSPIAKPANIPPYKTRVTCPKEMSADECAKVTALDTEAISLLNANAGNVAAWVEIGSVREEVGDYGGAATAWNFVTKIAPTSSVGYYDLGDLYLSYLKDYPKSEANFLLAAKYAPHDTTIYRNLFSLYTTTSYHPSADSAANILKQGIAANPQASDLYVLLARYYKAAGDATDAKVQYDAAVVAANKNGQTAVAQAIQAEEGQ